MPSFSIGAQCESARINARFYREARNNIYHEADTAVNACNAINVEDASANKFAQDLGNYLNTRRNEVHLFSCDNAQVSNRTRFIQKLIPFVKNKDLVQQINMLKEENICCFKGFFTQRLYDILAARRALLQQQVSRPQDQAVGVLPTSVRDLGYSTIRSSSHCGF